MKIDKSRFTQNHEAVRKAFTLEVNSLHAVGGLFLTASGIDVDKSELIECKKILKKNEGIFSSIRGNNQLPMVVKMCVSRDPEKYLKGVRETYDLLSDDFVFGSENRAMASMVLYENTTPENREQMCSKTMEFYRLMRKEHPLLTNQADLTFAVLMAAEGGDSSKRFEDAERCFEQLKENFVFSREALQTSAHILSLNSDSSSPDKVNRFMDIFNAFKKNHIKLTGDYMPIIAVLTNTSLPVDKVVALTKENIDFVKTLKGMGFMSASKSSKIMIAAAMTAIEQMDRNNAADTVASALLNIIIDIEILIMIMVINSSICAASSSN